MARFTNQQIEDAKRTNLEHFLLARGEKLMRSGGEYRWVYRDASGEHDSITVRGNAWFDHKRQIGGDAIGFLQEYQGMGFREAVATLLGGGPPLAISAAAGTRDAVPEQKPFTLPPKSDNMHRLYAYLCKTRGIDHHVVTHFVRAGVLYEEAQHHNAVFLATDENNRALGGMKKSTLSGSGFRQTMAGSDTRYAFHHKGESRRLYVFEAAVDMLSFITLYPEGWQQHSYLALDGVSSKALLHFLKTHDAVQEVCLCLDNDEAGHAATDRILIQLQKLGYEKIRILKPMMKDWNDEFKTHLCEAIAQKCNQAAKINCRSQGEIDMSLSF